MGISTWSHIRVSNLEGLIYKSGQTQISKASVSIVFNNTERSKSPVGYENCNKITVTRQIVNAKSKFMINGRSAQSNKVEQLFGSVQLNIHNPHFLVMQGKITKILLMKPVEILGMIQEASGTGTYERNKNQCQTKIQKKEKKLEEIQNILDNDIKPAMDRAKENRSKHLRIESLKTKVDNLKRQLQLILYGNAKSIITTSIEENDNIRFTLESCARDIDKIDKEVETLVKNIDDIKAKRGVDNTLKSLETGLKQLSTKLITAQSNYNHSQENLDEELNNISELKEELNSKIEEVIQLQRSFSSIKLQVSGKKEQVEQWKNRSSNLERALNGNGSVSSSSTSELIRCNQNIVEASAQIRMSQSNIKDLEREILSNEQKSERSKIEFEECKQVLQSQEFELRSIKERAEKLNFSKNKYQELEKRKSQIENKLQASQRNLDQRIQKTEILRILNEWEGRLSEKIKGPLVRLFEPIDRRYNLAISACVGGRLSNIVIDSDETGSRLVEEATRSGKRLTFLPMNKIQPHKINPQAKELAEKLGAKLAIDIIKYENSPGMDKIMQHVFGSFFVCENMQIAQKVCNDKRIEATAVSLDGSVYRPGGTLSGGYHDSKNDFVASAQEYNEFKQEHRKLAEELQSVEQSLFVMENVKKEFNKINEDINLKTHVIEMQRNTLEELSYESILKKIDTLKSKLEDEKQKLSTFIEKEESNKSRASQLQAEIEIFEKGVSDRRKIESQLKEAETKYKEIKKEYEDMTEKMNMLDAQIIEGGKEEISLKEKIEEKEMNLKELSQKHEILTQKHAKRLEEFNKQQQLINERQNELKQSENELMTMNIRREELRKIRNDKEAQQKTLTGRHKQIVEQISKAKNRVETMQRENPDLERELSHFNIHEYDEASIRKEIEDLEKRMNELSETVSENSLHDYEENEKKFNDLNKKKEKILNDRANIEESIRAWDDAKNNAVLQTFQKVNEDFSMIFSDLLPNATAKLVPTNPSDINEGVEFRVAFGGVWKESLIELSGGQKSLLGLSLILAFLRCKPAPLYILDEIDAALDPSHTQNIGMMLKRRFTNSQFIIISLKQGMFQNANVIYRTKLQNGQSSVERTVPNMNTLQSLANELANDDQENRIAARNEVEEVASKKRKRDEGNEQNTEFLLS